MFGTVGVLQDGKTDRVFSAAGRAAALRPRAARRCSGGIY